jgi:hypothetical protein
MTIHYSRVPLPGQYSLVVIDSDAAELPAQLAPAANHEGFTFTPRLNDTGIDA